VRRLVAACVCLIVLAATAATAWAHPSHWVVAMVEIRRDETFVVELILDRSFVPPHFGEKSPPVEIEGLPDATALRTESFGLLAAVTVRFDGRPVPTKAAWLAQKKEDELRLRLTGDVPLGARVVAVTNAIDGPWMTSARHEGEDSALVSMLDPKAPMPSFELRPEFSPNSAVRWAAEFLGFGFKHIIPYGLDHVLFVLGLFLLSTRLKPLLTQVTAFTAAHTVTLALSTTGVFRLSSSIVEPAIAASIAFVAIENLCTDRVRARRVLVVFMLGLLHGLGFAGALAELGLPAGHTALALLSFNAGVEFGQLAVLLAAWILVGRPFNKRPWYRKRVVVPGSIAIAAVGLWWTVTRIIGV
jgi:hypothetical protein